MLGQAIWWGSITLETLLLVRGLQGRLLARFPVFYVYILFVWLCAIPLGRNLSGILLGYGLFVGISVIQLTFVTNTASRFNRFWAHVSPGSYLMVLGLWALHLWSYAPNPEPKRAVRLEEQYQ